jgi:DNA polymerase-3 subunit gamma/tau
MAAQALYLKYRPRSFDEVVGQEAITRTLRNALREGRQRHAYLFTGPRGTGKTTTARLLAKAVNCVGPEGERPCNRCDICKAINEGRLLDLIEIDAASNRGIDEIRDLREKVGFRPNQARFKVYVLDEAHMLTDPAFNALLKTLEEPPPHAIFALVTTDPHKIPATIASRCQRFDFKRLSVQTVVDRLAYIAGQEGLRVEPAALELIARQSTGAMRDAISLLDQLTSYGQEITLDQVQMVLGTVMGEAAARLVSALVAGDVAGGLAVINQAVADGVDPRQLGREIVEYLRGMLLVKQGAGTRLLNATAEQAAEIEALSGQIGTGRLLEAIRLFNGAVMDLKSGLQTIPQLPLELALVQCTLDSRPASGLSPLAAVGETEQGSAASAPAPGPPVRQVAPPAPAAEANPEPAAGGGPAVPEATAGRTLREAGATDRGEPAAPPAPAAETQVAAAGGLTLAQVRAAWPDLLRAVRKRNKTTEAALHSGCKLGEVSSKEIVITLPNAFIRQQLDNVQRKQEIQDAFDEVLGMACRVRLVLETDYKPSPPPAGRPNAEPEDRPAAEPAGKPGSQAGGRPTGDARPAAEPTGRAGPDPSGKPRAEAPGMDQGDEVFNEVTRWAAERGGQARIVS